MKPRKAKFSPQLEKELEKIIQEFEAEEQHLKDNDPWYDYVQEQGEKEEMQMYYYNMRRNLEDW